MNERPKAIVRCYQMAIVRCNQMALSGNQAKIIGARHSVATHGIRWGSKDLKSNRRQSEAHVDLGLKFERCSAPNDENHLRREAGSDGGVGLGRGGRGGGDGGEPVPVECEG